MLSRKKWSTRRSSKLIRGSTERESHPWLGVWGGGGGQQTTTNRSDRAVLQPTAELRAEVATLRERLKRLNFCPPPDAPTPSDIQFQSSHSQDSAPRGRDLLDRQQRSPGSTPVLLSSDVIKPFPSLMLLQDEEEYRRSSADSMDLAMARAQLNDTDNTDDSTHSISSPHSSREGRLVSFYDNKVNHGTGSLRGVTHTQARALAQARAVHRNDARELHVDLETLLDIKRHLVEKRYHYTSGGHESRRTALHRACLDCCSRFGLEADPETLSALTAMAPPTETKEAESLGLTRTDSNCRRSLEQKRTMCLYRLERVLQMLRKGQLVQARQHTVAVKQVVANLERKAWSITERASENIGRFSPGLSHRHMTHSPPPHTPPASYSLSPSMSDVNQTTSTRVPRSSSREQLEHHHSTLHHHVDNRPDNRPDNNSDRLPDTSPDNSLSISEKHASPLPPHKGSDEQSTQASSSTQATTKKRCTVHAPASVLHSVSPTLSPTPTSGTPSNSPSPSSTTTHIKVTKVSASSASRQHIHFPISHSPTAQQTHPHSVHEHSPDGSSIISLLAEDGTSQCISKGSHEANKQNENGNGSLTVANNADLHKRAQQVRFHVPTHRKPLKAPLSPSSPPLKAPLSPLKAPLSPSSSPLKAPISSSPEAPVRSAIHRKEGRHVRQTPFRGAKHCSSPTTQPSTPPEPSHVSLLASNSNALVSDSPRRRYIVQARGSQ